MIKINGVKASIMNDETEKLNTTPSINQILERMDNNYQARNVNINQMSNFQNLNSQNIHNQNVSIQLNEQNANFGNLFDGNSIFSVLLPILLTGNKKVNLLGSDSPILKEILKRTNNPMIQKILELLPKLNENKKNETKTDSHKEKKQEAKIDSYVRTDEFENDNWLSFFNINYILNLLKISSAILLICLLSSIEHVLSFFAFGFPQMLKIFGPIHSKYSQSLKTALDMHWTAFLGDEKKVSLPV